MAIFKLRSLLSAVALINFSSTQIWNSLGCYTVTSDREMLTQVNTQGQLITPEICQTTCGDLGFTMAGVEKGVECWCSNLFETGSPSTACTVPCNGDSTQMCGGDGRINLYEIQFPSMESTKSLDTLNGVPASQIVEGQELKRHEEKRWNCKRGNSTILHILC